MRLEFATAGRIVFGPGTLGEAGQATRELGQRVFLVTGRDPARVQPVHDALAAAGLAITPHPVAGEPTTDGVSAALTAARAARCDVVVGAGGGSVLDCAKAVAALLGNPGEVTDYLEVVGKGLPLAHPGVPCVAIPTTAGSGAEVTRNAVLLSPAHRFKASLRGAAVLPRVALVDPTLTIGLPPAITAATGLDALTQLIEPFVSCRANPLTDGLCLEGIRRVARSLRRACAEGTDLAARADMALASLLGGIALANAGLGAVHGFASPIGGAHPAPHGAVCAALLPHVMQANLAAARDRQPGGGTLRRYEEVARQLTGRSDASAEDGIRFAGGLVADLGIPPLRTHGIRESDVPALVAKAAGASSMKANPLPLTTEELTAILTAAL